MTDFRIENHGSVTTIEAISEAARAFVGEYLVVEPWMGTPERFTTDWRPALALHEALEADGFTVEVNALEFDLHEAASEVL